MGRTRREWLATIGTLSAVTTGCLDAEDSQPATGDGQSGPSDEHPAGWPVAGYDAENTRRPPHDAPVDGVEERWRFDDRAVSTGFDDPAIAVADGTVYVGTEAGLLCAVDAETGEEAVLVDLDESEHREADAPLSAVTAFDDRLYLVSDGLYAVDAATGDEVWYFRGAPQEFEYPGTNSSPVVVGDTVYVGGYGVHAVDVETGDERWHFETESLPETPGDFDGTFGWLVSRTPAVSRGTVFFNAELPVLYAVDAATGEEEWRFEAEEGVIRGTPAVAGETVYQVGLDDLYARDVTTGEERWRADLSELDVPGSPAVADDAVYVAGGPLVGFDAETGDERWRADVNAEFERTVEFRHTSPAVTSEAVYAVDYNWSMSFAVSIPEETIRWHSEPTGSIGPAGGLVLADGVAYVVESTGDLVALGEP